MWCMRGVGIHTPRNPLYLSSFILHGVGMYVFFKILNLYFYILSKKERMWRYKYKNRKLHTPLHQ